ncbi:nucleotide disphospho-sugar-binding domain-containing protein [Nocardioides zeae]|uniref:DUF1205 domain-containing protein n=1 Tax=Nocardioides zeae TaxID=1457234 RepID=A0A6P0HGK0_9ACTN|nr:nucleotide disphospho-sugar-binding domain-containing protein [Nocardioides zeae]NEN77812.1 DUF1205 domain-containing protein [Nocardioides zeae]
MRVLVTTHAERTHLLGLVPLAWALRAEGHEVLVAVQPRLAATGHAAGLPVAAVGRDSQLWRVRGAVGGSDRVPGLGLGSGPHPGPADWPVLREELERVVPWWWRLVNDPMVDDLVGLARRWRPDLVLWGAVTFAGVLAARAAGAAHARVLFGVDLAGRLHAAYRRGRPPAVREDPLVDWLGRTADRLGTGFDAGDVLAAPTVDPLPPSLGRPDGERAGSTGPLHPLRFVPFNGDGTLPAWLRRPPRRPRVGVSLGHSSADDPARFRDLLAGLARLGGLEVVATAPAEVRRALGPLPEAVRVEPFVPLDALAATCQVVVDHGGGGTVCTVARHGVPQLVVPQHYDEPVLAARIERAGAGLALAPEHATPAAVHDAVQRLLEEERFRAGAAALRRELLAMPSARRVAADLGAGVAAAQAATGRAASASS